MASRRSVLLAASGVAALGGAGALYKLSGPGGTAGAGRGRATRVQTDALPPTQADVVIIGGGIAGTITAFHLARRGVSVVLCEKGEIAGEASGRAVGQVVSGGLDPGKMDLVRFAKEEWSRMNTAIGGESGYRQDGYLSPFSSAEEGDFWTSWHQSVRDFEPSARFLSAAEVKAKLGSDAFKGAYFNPTDGGVEPTLAAPAIAEAARRHGAKLVAPCAVRGVEMSAGRVSGVVTEKGRIQASSVVLAGGCWSPMFAENLGLHLPGLNIFSVVRSVYDVEGGPPGTGDFPEVSWRKQLDGGYTVSVVGGTVPVVPAMFKLGTEYFQALREAHWDVRLNLGSYFFDQLGVRKRWTLDEVSPFEETRVLEPSSNPPLAQRALDEIKRRLPAFERMRAGPVWGGALIATPDNMPTVSAVRSHPGLFMATGLTYGMTMGPAIGALMADLVTGQQPRIDPRPYRYERYIDGSKLRFTA